MSDRFWSLVAVAADKVRGLIDRLLAVRIVESSIVLAAQAFLALFPLVIVVYAVIPAGAASGLLDQLRNRVGLAGESADAVHHLLVDRDSLRSGLSVISFVLVIGSATAFTRALQRVYQNAWALPKLGLRGLWRTIAWLIGVICYLGVIGWIVHVIRNNGVTTPITVVLGLGLWWWTPFLLLGGRVRWRALLPGAVLTTLAQVVVALLSVVIMPRELRNNEATYGPIGAVFALESWFVIVSGVLVAAAAFGAAMGRDEGWFGTWVRGSADPDAWRRRTRLRPDEPGQDTGVG